MEILFWVACIIWFIFFVRVAGKLIKYKKIIKQYMETDINQLYQENRKLKKQIQDLSNGLDDIWEILDEFEDENEKN